MTKKHDLTNKSELRRKDREIKDDEWIIDFLAKAPYGYVATVMDGQPFITMAIFVYDRATHAIYLHTSKYGRLAANVRQDYNACFSFGTIGRMLPAEHAREFSNEYESVVAFGKIEILEDMVFARDKMHQMIDKYFSHLKRDTDYRAITKTEILEIATYKISIESWSAKKKEEAEDYPGAFIFNK